MIDKHGKLRCDVCDRILGELKDNELRVKCSRSGCDKYTIFPFKKEYQSHKLLALTKE